MVLLLLLLMEVRELRISEDVLRGDPAPESRGNGFQKRFGILLNTGGRDEVPRDEELPREQIHLHPVLPEFCEVRDTKITTSSRPPLHPREEVEDFVCGNRIDPS